MSDILINFDPDLYTGDLLLDDGSLSTDQGLRTAVFISLFTDRRALESDVIPDGGTDRRGWWGDLLSDTEGDQIGSRLWLLQRQKVTTETLRRTEEYAREALQWMVEDRVASAIDVTAVEVLPRVPGRGSVMGIDITIHRPAKPAITYKFDKLWSET